MFDIATLLMNPYAIPVLLVGLLIGPFGILVVARERGSQVGWLFLGLSLSVGLYLLAAGISYSIEDATVSLWWARAAHVGVSLMPLGVLGATMGILGQVEKRRVVLALAAAITMVFSALAVFTNLFIRGNIAREWGNYPQYGIVGFIFIAYFAAVMVASLFFFWREYRHSTNPVHRRRLRGILIGFGIGYIASVDFLPAIGVDMYAFGYLPILFFLLVIAYVILRFHFTDITPAVASEQILETMHGIVVVADLAGVIRVANPRAQDVLGTKDGALIGTQISSLIGLPAKWASPDEIETPIRDYELEIPDGDRTSTFSLSASPLRDRRGTLIGRVYVGHDITDRKEVERELAALALHDPLTGLPNRVLFFDRLDQLLALAARNQFILAILYMDLDRFKDINDTLGHEAGDELLRQVSARMKGVTRTSDTIARMGGDEFIGVCGRIASAGDAEIVAAKLVDVLAGPFTLEGVDATVGVSIGISVYPADGADGRTLLACADQAMYRVKSLGGNGFAAYGTASPGSPSAQV